MANGRSAEQIDAEITRALRHPEGRRIAELLTIEKLLRGMLTSSSIRAEMPVWAVFFRTVFGSSGERVSGES